MKTMPGFCAALMTLAVSVGCNLPGAPSTPAQAWIDAPRDGMQLPLEPYTVIFHGSDHGGVSRMEVSVDGAVLQTVENPDASALLVHLDYSWQPLTSGRHVISVRTQNTAGAWGQQASVTVEIVPGLTVTVSATPTLTPTGTLTPSVTPTRTRRPTITPSPTAKKLAPGKVTFDLVSPHLVYFGDSSCGPRDVTITAHAVDPKGITVVVLFYRFQGEGASDAYQNVAMHSMGNDIYEASLNPTSLLGGSAAFSKATLQYQALVQETDGDTSVRTPVRSDITVRACGPVRPACPTYADQSTCEAHGCQWVSSIPGIVARMVCKNP